MRIVAKDKKDALDQVEALIAKGFELEAIDVVDENGEAIDINVRLIDVPDAPAEVAEGVKSANAVEVKKTSDGKDFWKAVGDASQGGLPLVVKTTTSTDVDSAVVEGVTAVFNEVFGGELVQELTRIPMDSNSLRIPNFYLSGVAGTTVETSGKNAVDIRDRYTKLETQAYNAYVVHTRQASLNLPALQGLITDHLVAAIQEDLDYEVIATLLAASGQYVQAGAASATGLVTPADMIAMYTRLEQRRLKNPAWLVHPTQFAAIMEFDSGVRVIADGPKMTYFGIPIITTAALTTAASGASGSVVLAGLGNVVMGVQGDGINTAFNPFYGWTTNTESTRAEIFADIECEVQSSFTRANGAQSGWESSFYVVLDKA